MKRELDRIGYSLKPLDIVVVNTAAGKAYGLSLIHISEPTRPY